MKRPVEYLVICVLSLVVIWKGILPAFTQLDTDFPNYYTASRLLLDGKDVSRIYDDHWFQAQLYSYGIEQEGKFTPFPPATAFLMLPLAEFDPLTALRIWTLFNILLLVASTLVVSVLTRNDWQWSSILVLGCGTALINNFRFGQWYLALAFLMLAGFYFLERKQAVVSGILFGIGAAFKYFPIIFLPLFFLHKEWRGSLAFVLTIAAIELAAVVVMGSQVHTEFITNVLRPHLTGNIQDPFSASLQSWESLFRRLYVYDPLRNPSPVVNSESMYYASICLVTVCAVGALLWCLTFAENMRDHRALELQVSLFALAAVLLLPASATYHFLLLVLPVGLFLRTGNIWNIWQRMLVGCYLVIGFLPYRFFRYFEGKQWLTVLAYPRLWVLTIMFIAGCCYVAGCLRPRAQAGPVPV